MIKRLFLCRETVPTISDKNHTVGILCGGESFDEIERMYKHHREITGINYQIKCVHEITRLTELHNYYGGYSPIEVSRYQLLVYSGEHYDYSYVTYLDEDFSVFGYLFTEACMIYTFDTLNPVLPPLVRTEIMRDIPAKNYYTTNRPSNEVFNDIIKPAIIEESKKYSSYDSYYKLDYARYIATNKTPYVFVFFDTIDIEYITKLYEITYDVIVYVYNSTRNQLTRLDDLKRVLPNKDCSKNLYSIRSKSLVV